MKITKEQIGRSEIVKSIFINNKWKVSVIFNDDIYTFRIEADELVTDGALSDLIYKEMLLTDVKEALTPITVTEKETLNGSKPTEIRK